MTISTKQWLSANTLIIFAFLAGVLFGREISCREYAVKAKRPAISEPAAPCEQGRYVVTPSGVVGDSMQSECAPTTEKEE
jgi:hypothetical protein